MWKSARKPVQNAVSWPARFAESAVCVRRCRPVAQIQVFERNGLLEKMWINRFENHSRCCAFAGGGFRPRMASLRREARVSGLFADWQGAFIRAVAIDGIDGFDVDIAAINLLETLCARWVRGRERGRKGRKRCGYFQPQTTGNAVSFDRERDRPRTIASSRRFRCGHPPSKTNRNAVHAKGEGAGFRPERDPFPPMWITGHPIHSKRCAF